ncbi:Biphenyl-2,3-diol 1,2-dioxygenase 2 [Pigmentiphaga humi]|uniref:Biphenyl-2,3-diol 1,2-dioxygenase 2 n=1 Tax=Pigmentiphaga humi TaxID=2478468 RepID=A0A3P4B0E7_9BURK|nr:VOC family protein [Pigmentiphaga humi]VCU69769.1 Biphenyl-2,3-diol 1,2-dioxygenase 2 [Pigmentiphaga humi]
MQKKPGLSFSHVGIFVRDIVRMADFYSNVLDFTITDRGKLDSPHGPLDLVFTSRDPDVHHQIVLVSGRPEHVPFNVINQLSLQADSLETLQAFYRRLKDDPGVSDLQPVTHGNALSLYCRDPEGNRLELYVDTPWYVSQPMRVPMPIELPPDELMAWSERHARALPGFCSREEWRAKMARKMDAAASGAQA